MNRIFFKEEKEEKKKMYIFIYKFKSEHLPIVNLARGTALTIITQTHKDRDIAQPELGPIYKYCRAQIMVAH